MRPLAENDLIDGRFQIQAKLGEGSQGTVYRVLDLNGGRVCALKLLDQGDPDSRARFAREGRLGLNLRHANLVEVFEAGRIWRGHPYLVMEFLEHMVPLHACWPDLNWARFLSIAEQVASALDFLASYDLVHRDLSPSNVLVDAVQRVKVIDLGLAHEAGSGLTHTSLVDVMGSPGYLPPEQLERAKSVEPASDQWALAAIVYQALTGVPPHFNITDHEDAAELSALQRIADGAPLASPSRHNPSVGRNLDASLLKALSPRPGDRFRTRSPSLLS